MDITTHDIQVDWEAVAEARLIPPGRKAAIGGELFEAVCERMREGIRAQFPGYSEPQVTAELLRRLELSRQLELRI